MGNTTNQVQPHSLLTDFDIDLFRAGRHYKLHDKLGAHITEKDGKKGVLFAVWAPNAKKVAVSGGFNYWDNITHQLNPRWDGSGIWEGFVPSIGHGELYKYIITTKTGEQLEKSDPFAFFAEVAPKTASIVWGLDYKWKDPKWMKGRSENNAINAPMSVYEVHLGSWKRVFEDGNRSLSYEEMADQLVSYIKDTGFTHVEFLPCMEHPFFGSWGYQITGYFAATSRFGTPQELMFLIDKFHQSGVGVILDWVPSHFPGDAHGLAKFDGTHLFEHEDPKKGYHPDWKSYIFNYGRNETKSFLISNAIFWLEKYHIDGIRVDAVASMLYLDYSRNEGEWIPNEHGGRENLEAVSFLKEMNEAVYSSFPDVQTIAEESTAWPMVSKPTFLGGLGFGMKWMMGWMNDTLEYFKVDPLYRQHHQNSISFSLTYAFTENFMLPLSHDEVVHGKGPLIDRMPGDEWQRFANLRLMYGYMFTHPGTKLLFMGAEFGQTSEWNHDQSLDWSLLDHAPHQGMLSFIKALNRLYKTEKALFEKGFEADGFEWIDYSDAENPVISYVRKGHDVEDNVLVICNLTPIVTEHYRLGVFGASEWKEILNSDASEFHGSGVINYDNINTEGIPAHGHQNSICITLPPLGITVFKAVKKKIKQL